MEVKASKQSIRLGSGEVATATIVIVGGEGLIIHFYTRDGPFKIIQWTDHIPTAEEIRELVENEYYKYWQVYLSIEKCRKILEDFTPTKFDIFTDEHIDLSDEMLSDISYLYQSLFPSCEKHGFAEALRESGLPQLSYNKFRDYYNKAIELIKIKNNGK